MPNPHLADREDDARKYLAGLTDNQLEFVTHFPDEAFVNDGWRDAGVMAVLAKQDKDRRAK